MGTIIDVLLGMMVWWDWHVSKEGIVSRKTTLWNIFILWNSPWLQTTQRSPRLHTLPNTLRLPLLSMEMQSLLTFLQAQKTPFGCVQCAKPHRENQTWLDTIHVMNGFTSNVSASIWLPKKTEVVLPWLWFPEKTEG